MTAIELATIKEEQIAARLARAYRGKLKTRYPPQIISPNPKPAAVLIPLLRQAGEWHLLFIRRSNEQRDPHSGQVAFPGGASESQDASLELTALRETQEELGIAPTDVRILGKLDDELTITSYRVTPFVGCIPWPYPLKPAKNEVSHVFTIPLVWLADPANRRIEHRILPPPYEPVPVIYFAPYNGEVLWGASAGFTLSLLQAIAGE